MLILSIDCAGSGCGVCVFQNGNVIAAAHEVMERGQDQRLMPLIVEMMQQASVSFDQLDRIAVTRGPGSFTGLRIGLAAARGIGLAAGKPVIGIDRFAIYREQFLGGCLKHFSNGAMEEMKFLPPWGEARRGVGEDALTDTEASRKMVTSTPPLPPPQGEGKTPSTTAPNLLVIINSRRNELYCRFYPVTGQATEPMMWTAEEITMFLKNKNNMIVTGDFIDISPSRLREGLGEGWQTQDVGLSPPSVQRFAAQCFSITPASGREAPTASFLHATEPEHITAARLAAIANPENPDHLPRPLYIRAPDVTMPKNNLTVQRLGQEHAERMAELHAESFGKKKWSLQQFKSSLALDTTRGWGVIQGTTVVGFILCQLIPDQSEILALCVRPGHRRQGIGEKLLNAAADAAQEAGSHLYLEVAEDNVAAITLYTKRGFIQTGNRPRYYQMGKQTVDAILFTLEINPTPCP